MIIDHWNDELNSLSADRRDVYFTEEYCKLHTFARRESLAFVYEDKDSIYILPILVGEIPESGGFFDFETPYGYGGPVTNNDDQSFIESAERQLVRDCQGAGIIAGFVRFHPVLDNAHLTAGAFTIIPDRRTVAIDLSGDDLDLWENQLHSKNRNTIRKARHNGFTFVADESFLFLEDFKRLYRQTMQRNVADEFYNFEDDYFGGLASQLKGRAFIGIVQHMNTPVAAAIFLYDGPWAHYHLAGSDYEAAKKGANNLLLYESALYLRNKGARVLHLGGGTDQSENNSLLNFKRKFSPRTFQFSIGRCIFMEDLYEQLCAKWEKTCPDKVAEFGHMVLKYRF